jgi:hypothetical protein
VSVYPNPASAYVRIDAVGDTRVLSVSIVDLHGREVYLPDAAGEGLVDIRELPAGIYVAIIETGSGRLMEKLVIQR